MRLSRCAASGSFASGRALCPPSRVFCTLAVIWVLGQAIRVEGKERLTAEQACAAFDVHYLTLIEDHGRAEEIGPEVIFEAALTLIDARAACRTGDFARGISLYSFLSLAAPGVAPSDWVLLR